MKKILSVSLFSCVMIFGPILLPAQGKENGTVEKIRAARKISSAGFSLRIEPAPEWVAPVEHQDEGHVVASPMHYELIDEQARVEPSSASFYSHLTRIVNDASGLGVAAQIQFDFDPSYQTLIFHKLEIWRGGRRINKLQKKSVRLLQRESKLEYQSYDGRVTASVVLDDVRVGDKIDYAYTLRGMNPVFDGKFLHMTWAGAEKGPVSLFQFRLLAPENRMINYRAGPDVKMATALKGGMRETIFRRPSISQMQWDPYAPISSYLADQIQFSEYRDWAEVAAWGQRLFSQAAVPSPAVHKLAESILASSPTPEERLEHALDFVQKKVRYFGMEFGAGSHRPAYPAVVIEQRFGDCKDKISLLVALLRELDIDAVPVLVSTRYRTDTGILLPNPQAFDHVIAMVKLQDRTFWLDGTRDHQTGPLARRQSTGLGRGLPLQASTKDLIELPGAASEERITVEDKFRAEKLSEDVVLESDIIYYGEIAEYIRNRIAAQSITPLEKELAAEYGRLYPKIRSSAPIRVEEVLGKNALRVVQQFTLPQLWRFPDQKALSADVALWNIFETLRYPNEPVRKKPLRIQSPGIYRHNISFEFGEDVYRNKNSSRFNDGSPHFAFHLTYENSLRHAQISAELDLLRDVVTPDEWAGFIDKIVKLRPKFSASVIVSPITLAQSEKLKTDLESLGQAFRKGREKVVTAVQAEAKARRILLTAELESGRLNPILRAEVFRRRGVQIDYLGLPDTAANDFDQAILLAPGDAEIHGEAAVNAFLREKDELAVEHANKALQLAPSDTTSLNVRAFARYYMGKYAEAKEDLLAEIKNSSTSENGYPAIWTYLTVRRMGEDGNDAINDYLSSVSEPHWPDQVLQLLTGHMDYQEAFKAATENQKDPSRLCELYFYVGEKYLIDGDRRRAKEFFQKAIDTGVVEFNEYTMSKRSMKRMEEK